MANNSTKVKNSLVLNPVDLSTLINPEPGDLACDINDENKIKRYDSQLSAWVEVGGGDGGGLDVFYSESVDKLSNTSIFNTGSSPFFAGGGTLAGTFELEEVEPISGNKSLKYTQAFGSSEDYFASEIIDIFPKQQNKNNSLTFYFNYDGNDNDGKFVVYDVTNDQIISNELSLVKNTGGQASRYSLSFTVPSSCTQIRWGYQVLVENVGVVLLVDDIEMSSDPFVETNIDNITDWQSYTPTSLNFGGFGTVTNFSGKYRQVGDSIEVTGFFNCGTAGAARGFVPLPNGFNVDFNKITSFRTPVGQIENQGGFGLVRALYVDPADGNIYMGVGESGGLGTGTLDNRNVNTFFGPNTAIGFKFSVPCAGLTALTTSILTPSDTFSTDTAPLTYAPISQYTLSTLENAPVGTFITFTYAANTNTRTQTTTAPSQSTADMNQNGIRIFARPHNASSTAASPAAVAIQIGKGVKGHQLSVYAGIGKINEGDYDYSVLNSSTEAGLLQNYNEKTGVLTIDTGYCKLTTTSIRLLGVDMANQVSLGNGYLTINAGRTLPLLAVPTPLVAYLKDVKPNGVNGGTFTSGAWQTRTLNTIEGNGSIVSLSGNQFTLGSGRYKITANAPAAYCNFHKLRLQNITDASTSILGGNEFAHASGTAESNSRALLMGVIVLTSSKTFELQHQCSATRANTGFGHANSFGVDEIYAQMRIEKVE